jgi:hypothetical protein
MVHLYRLIHKTSPTGIIDNSNTCKERTNNIKYGLQYARIITLVYCSALLLTLTVSQVYVHKTQ